MSMPAVQSGLESTPDTRGRHVADPASQSSAEMQRNREADIKLTGPMVWLEALFAQCKSDPARG